MKRILALGLVAVSLAGCAADTYRTVPVVRVDDEPIGSVIYDDRRPIIVPQNRVYLSPPGYRDSVITDWNRNNFIGHRHPVPPPRPYMEPRHHQPLFTDRGVNRPVPVPPPRPPRCQHGQTQNCLK